MSVPERSRLAVRAAAEFAGTGFLLAAIVGSGIMGERLSNGNQALTLLANSIATGCALWVLITATGPLSGAHLNPLVTLSAALRCELDARVAVAYLIAQIGGAIFGVVIAHVMFTAPLISTYTRPRAGVGMLVGEIVATFGLLTTIELCAIFSPDRTATGVACFITAAYWFTSSTSFANPAVTIGRSLSGTFSGIRRVDVPLFLAGQFVGAALALPLGRLRRSAHR